jgi:hypothetical protein
MAFRVGDSVEVYCDEEEDWLKGTVDKIERKRGLHVAFEDGDQEWITFDAMARQQVRHAKEEGGEAKTKTKKQSNAAGGEVTKACEIDGCTYSSKWAGTLRRHQASVHGFDVDYYVCSQDGCVFRAKKGGNLKRHLADIHDIGVEWHECDQKGCSFKSKEAGPLRRHQQEGVHEIAV